jgi:polysaccharide export outer membrane protein
MNRTFSLKTTLKILCLIGFLGMSSLDLSAEDLLKKEYTVGPDDMLVIQIWDNENLNRTVEVSQEGPFTFPLIGKVSAEGFTVFELENLVRARLADGFISNPQVTISMSRYLNRKVFLLGEVKSPGSYVLKRKTHILELISEAGGFTDEAGRIIKIVRPRALKHSRGLSSHKSDEENEIIELDLDEFPDDSASNNFYVASGDSIYVSKVSRVFIIGEVLRTGEFKWESGLTIHQVISRAGGPNESAALNRTKIIRINKNGKEKKIRVRMDDLARPEDIIKVPGRYF